MHLLRPSGPGLNVDGVMDGEALLSPMSINGGYEIQIRINGGTPAGYRSRHLA